MSRAPLSFAVTPCRFRLPILRQRIAGADALFKNSTRRIDRVNDCGVKRRRFRHMLIVGVMALGLFGVGHAGGC